MTKTSSDRLDRFIAFETKVWTLPGFVLQSSIGQQTFKRIPSQSSQRKIFKPAKSYFPGALRPEDSKEQGRAFQQRSCLLFSVVSFPWNRHPRQRKTKTGSRNSMESRSLRFAPAIS
jgi:hypothetical protein